MSPRTDNFGKILCQRKSITSRDIGGFISSKVYECGVLNFEALHTYYDALEKTLNESKVSIKAQYERENTDTYFCYVITVRDEKSIWLGYGIVKMKNKNGVQGYNFGKLGTRSGGQRSQFQSFEPHDFDSGLILF